MNLKCIGGERDGFVINVSDNLKVHDFVRVQEKLKPINIAMLGSIDETVTHYYIYTISYFCFTKDDIYKFLKPEGWTDKQAIIHQFNK